jgi:type I site-specific restriction endonuclease
MGEKRFSGVFAMATGTGKTITSLNCLLNIFNEEKKIQSNYFSSFLSLY